MAVDSSLAVRSGLTLTTVGCTVDGVGLPLLSDLLVRMARRAVEGLACVVPAPAAAVGARVAVDFFSAVLVG